MAAGKRICCRTDGEQSERHGYRSRSRSDSCFGSRFRSSFPATATGSFRAAAGAGSGPRGEAAGAHNWLRGDQDRAQNAAAPSGQADAASRTGREPETVLSWETGAGTNHLIPGLEVGGFLVLLSACDRTVLGNKREPDGESTYRTNLSTFWNHPRKENWTYDTDPFNINQIGHPYQGATMYGLARSSSVFGSPLPTVTRGAFSGRWGARTAAHR